MGTDYDSLILSHPAAVILRSQVEARAQAIERRALDESALEGETPFFWSAEISNGRLDSHYTRMDVSSLRNYAQDAEAGVSFLYGHDNREVIGRSLGGQFVGGQGNGVARVLADFYSVAGIQLGTVSSDQVIRAIRTGILRDVSIGFYGGELECSICGRDILRDWECRHYPGFKYEVEHDGKTEEVMCTADVKNAHLAETSSVYKGSTPGAVVVKAERDAEAGTMKPEARQLIEQRYRIHLPEKRVVAPGHKERNEVAEREADTTQPGGAENAPGTEQGNPPSAQDPPAPPQSDASATDEAREVSQLLTRAGVTNASVTTPLLAVRALVDECERLKPLADDGERYRTRLRERVVQEQVRAVGTASESFKGMVSRATVGELEGLLVDLGAKGDEVFGGGRRTVDGTDLPDEPERETRAADSIPPAYTAAYSAS
jgi:hypothetical protein